MLVASPHICVSSANPLAQRHIVTLEDLEPYSCLSFEQEVHNSFYFSEEILNTLKHKKIFWYATGPLCSIC